MKLKKIILNNIRSYEYQEINFPEGSTLLSGDIGSGKTSVLLGIEFALFGLQPGQKGSSILRNGQVQGGVIIEFEVDEKNVIVERKLKKGKTISQDYCSITIDDEKQETSVTELKNKVLELLNYPKEFSKKQNILYKFTVYTPQEEMKQIILEDSETRINTLRHVFGMDKYKKILENSSILISKVREEKRIKEAITINIEQDKLNITSKENELEEKYLNLSSIEKELFLKTETRKRAQEEKEEVYKKIEEKTKLQQEIEKTKFLISTKQDTIFGNKKQIEQIKVQISELEELQFEDNKIIELEREISNLRSEKQILNDKNLQVTSKIHSLTLKNKENELIKDKLDKIEVCPTCLQDVDPVYKTNVLNKTESDSVENTNKINELSIEKVEIQEKIRKLDQDLLFKEKKSQELKILKIKLQGIQERQKHLETLKKSNSLIEKDIDILEGQKKLLSNLIFDLNKYDNLYEEKQKGLNDALKEEKFAEIKVAELKREIDVFSRQITELKERIKKIEQIKKQVHHLSDLEEWITKRFISMISIIEKNVLTKLKTEFSELFSEWFSMLVSDSFNVRLSDDFTPIIELQDYEIDYAYLSGGERTAVALAYRLALNQVINSFLSKIKTKNLVILDEPTDG
ncbi:MAG TPA: AAA family ATPase, partial [Candidatus Pacearchaeota archaeon]|nr:AAA family ATPase [Candidatus Pacearchaeota archaeon]